jgi:hypothetical protein
VLSDDRFARLWKEVTTDNRGLPSALNMLTMSCLTEKGGETLKGRKREREHKVRFRPRIPFFRMRREVKPLWLTWRFNFVGYFCESNAHAEL